MDLISQAQKLVQSRETGSIDDAFLRKLSTSNDIKRREVYNLLYKDGKCQVAISRAFVRQKLMQALCGTSPDGVYGNNTHTAAEVARVKGMVFEDDLYAWATTRVSGSNTTMKRADIIKKHGIVGRTYGNSQSVVNSAIRAILPECEYFKRWGFSEADVKYLLDFTAALESKNYSSTVINESSGCIGIYQFTYATFVNTYNTMRDIERKLAPAVIRNGKVVSMPDQEAFVLLVTDVYESTRVVVKAYNNYGRELQNTTWRNWCASKLESPYTDRYLKCAILYGCHNLGVNSYTDLLIIHDKGQRPTLSAHVNQSSEAKTLHRSVALCGQSNSIDALSCHRQLA